MTKTNLKIADHNLAPDQQTVEVWHEGKFIAAIYGADGPGVRVITKYTYDIVRGGLGETELKVVEVKIEVEG